MVSTAWLETALVYAAMAQTTGTDRAQHSTLSIPFHHLLVSHTFQIIVYRPDVVHGPDVVYRPDVVHRPNVVYGPDVVNGHAIFFLNYLFL